ncbi:NUDIX hydrolase, partial [Candidatus Gastranaerophilus sp. (ex Termes propinquus)]
MKKILYKTPYLELRSAQKLHGGEWVYAHRANVRDIVIIVPFIQNEKVLF